MPCTWCIPNTTLPFYTIKACVSRLPAWAPRRGHGQALDHVLYVVSSDSTTPQVTCCYCYGDMLPPSGWCPY
nr:MAG TPA: hypothetical protein [Caudoviricetes sp.]